MKFITNIEKDKYNNFVKNHIKSHFLQSYEWGEFAKLEKGLTPHYIGLVDDNENLVCTALLLQKKLPFGYSYFYSPRGFVIDFNNRELLTEFIINIKKYTKKYKSIFIKIDPDLIINRYDVSGNRSNDYNKDIIIKNLSDNKFKHMGFTQKFETMQPRFSYRIDNSKSLEEIIGNFSKTTKQRIKKAEELDVDVRIGTVEDIDKFYELMRITENRKDFITHNLSYYKTLYNLFNEDDGVNLFIGSVNIKNIISKIDKEINNIKNEKENLETIENKSKSQNTKLKEITKQYESLVNKREKYNVYLDEFNDEIILNGHYIIKYGDMAWVLYAGNHNILTDTYSNYETYLKHISYYHDKVKIYDQFGTVGNISDDDTLKGLDDFKKKFGGDYVEFIGEFDLVLNKVMYIVFTKLVPIYRNIIKKNAKKKNR